MRSPPDGDYSQQYDYDEDAWDALCLARMYHNLHYRSAPHRGGWYRALRKYTSYSGTMGVKVRLLGEEIDRWLVAHPTWCAARYEIKPSHIPPPHYP